MAHHIRDLGKVEQFFHALTISKKYNNFSLIVQPDRVPTKSQLHFKLKTILQNSPVLASVIEDKKIHLPETAYLDQFLSSWDDLEGSITLDSLFSKIDKLRFEYGFEKHLFKIIFAGQYVILAMDHSLFDGASLINLGNELFESDFIEDSNIDEPVYQYDSNHTISKPFEDLLDFNSFEKEQQLESELESYKSNIKSYGSDHQCIVKTIPIPDLSISLTSKIQKSWVESMITTLPQLYNNSLKYGTCFGINTRGFLPKDESTSYGCYSAGFFQSIDPNVDVKLYSDELRAQIGTGSAIQPYLSMFTYEGHKDWLERFGDGLKNDTERGLLGVTNIGKLKINSWFFQTTSNLEFVFGVNVMRYNDELRLIFTMVDNDVVDLSQFELVVEEFIKVLK